MACPASASGLNFSSISLFFHRRYFRAREASMSRESQQFSPELPEGARPVEWLETNGLGGYASGTDCACNSRRYHGLLVINLPGIGRHVLLSNVEDWLLAGGKKYALSSRRHPGVYYPDGPRFQTAFAHRFYDRRYGRVDGAPLLAHWFFTLKASVCFVNYMDCHGMFPPYFETRSSVFSSFRFLQTNHSTALWPLQERRCTFCRTA